MPKKRIAFKAHTPLSRTLVIILFFVLPIIGFYFGAKYSADMVNVNTENISPQKQSTIPEEFLNANFRVIKVVKSTLSPYFIIVAGKREKDIQCGNHDTRCFNDVSCGSIYNASACYFFAEPDFVFGTNPQTRYLGKLERGSGAIFSYDTVVSFTDNSHMQFTSDFVEGGEPKKWQLNIIDGGLTQLP